MENTQTTTSTRAKVAIAGVAALVAFLTVALPYLLIPASFEPPTVEPPELPPLSAPQEEVQPFEDLVAAFYERVPTRAPNPYQYERSGMQGDCFEIAYACLTKRESPGTLIRLFSYPDPQVRASAVHSLADAQNALGADGFLALRNFLNGLSVEGGKTTLGACLEVLIEDTNAGIDSNVPLILGQLGNQEAIPTLMWSASVHPSSNMRTWTMNAISILNPKWKVMAGVFGERLQDPNADVRRQAVQGVFFYGLESLLGYR